MIWLMRSSIGYVWSIIDRGFNYGIRLFPFITIIPKRGKAKDDIYLAEIYGSRSIAEIID